MTAKKAKKPTNGELIQTLLAQVAELRGRLERLEQRPSIQVVQPAVPAQREPVWWESPFRWISGNDR